jgi:hypothetical protein
MDLYVTYYDGSVHTYLEDVPMFIATNKLNELIEEFENKGIFLIKENSKHMNWQFATIKNGWYCCLAMSHGKMYNVNK